MALLTPMTVEQARRLGALYGLDVEAVGAVARGINSNFVLHLSGGGRVFARVCEQLTLHQVESQSRLLQHLAARGVPTPEPLRRRDGGRTVGAHAGKPVMLFPFCRGRWLCQRQVTPEHTRQLGRALAQLHVASEGYEHEAVAPWDGAGLVERVGGLLQLRLPNGVRDDLLLARERLRELERRGELSLSSKTIVHGDLFRDNVLWEGGRLSALLDFEFAAVGSPAFDLMVTMLAWCFTDRLEASLARDLLSGYGAERPLAPDEVTTLYGQAQRAAIRFAVSRIADYELRPREVIAYKDYRRFLARLQAVEDIGAARFVRWLTAK